MTDEQAWVSVFWSTVGIIVICLLAWNIGIASDNIREQALVKANAELVVQHPSWPWTVINEHKIRLGMTTEMVQASWGHPRHINRSVGSWGVHEQWVYGGYEGFSSQYLYFDDGILTSWSD